ncbi:MAG TPA: flagellar motor switch protein FliM [Planctomycetaceae bacterium]|nr:flagellar motor switch protein FliM [Planctomycetaceae bacterium]HRF02899.1 flagellar motor switch protein FliM [Pirellulaceae bacterium]
MEEEVLSQDEVESLLQAMETAAPKPTRRGSDGESPDVPARLRTREKITPYDFKRPERVGKEQMRALQTLHEGFSRNFAASLSGLIRAMVEVKLTSVDQLTYSEFVFSLENPTCFNVLRASPLEGNIILDINPAVVYPILDRLLGGRDGSTPLRRPLTEIELRLVSRVTNLFIAEMRRAWENVMSLDIAIERVESNPQLVSIVPPNEVIVLISFELTIGQLRGMMNLCIPYNAIERISSRLTANTWQSYGKRTATETTRGRITQQIRRSPLEVSVTLAESRITTSELIGLRVGDVITTDHDIRQPLDVIVEGRLKYRARPGAVKGRKAIRIEEVLPAPMTEPESREG